MSYREYYSNGDGEPVRCEADAVQQFPTPIVYVCQWRIPLGGKCPNESSHMTETGPWQGGNDEWEETFSQAD